MTNSFTTFFFPNSELVWLKKQKTLLQQQINEAEINQHIWALKYTQLSKQLTTLNEDITAHTSCKLASENPLHIMSNNLTRD